MIYPRNDTLDTVETHISPLLYRDETWDSVQEGYIYIKYPQTCTYMILALQPIGYCYLVFGISTVVTQFPASVFFMFYTTEHDLANLHEF